ncbi:hypothetical protein [Cohnella zeiphila]|uniref:Uncharacterized protein n=1 Tax=Cohnella zeiphila TaxID=2761120 RepID=A0A7X0SP45_9BACL|nr:hypothetical protein [Cohnella zeiphila]MBB6733592.1 hypothetical protein [Cohnella zeiphila]
MLRSHELEAYRTAYYLLQDETKAFEAARRALLSFIKMTPKLAEWTDAERQAAVNKAALRESLTLVRETLSDRLQS